METQLGVAIGELHESVAGHESRIESTESTVSGVQWAVEQLSNNKLDGSTEYMKREEDGCLQVMSNLYISDVWRIVANTSAGSRRLEFQNLNAAGEWRVAVPFIRPAF